MSVPTTLPTIFLIRHGEKPTDTVHGVTIDGTESHHSLSPLGWQRAGALVPFFCTPTTTAVLPPATIFAAAPTASDTDSSHREEETAEPLAQRLGLTLNRSFGKGDHAAVAQAARTSPGPVLLVWEHDNIPKLARDLCTSPGIPSHWPSDRFDLVFVFTPTPAGYTFHQLPQLLLAGDSPTLLP